MGEGTKEIVALAEALRIPLLRLHIRSNESVQSSEEIQTITEHALRDIDAFITTITQSQTEQLPLEPLYLGSILTDTKARLKGYASLQNVSIEVDDHSWHRAILTNPAVVRKAYELLVKTLCDFATDLPRPVVRLSADTRHGYPRLGVYRSDIELTAEDIHLAKKLLGGATVNAGLFQQLGALRLVIADKLLEPCGIRVRSAQSNKQHGVALRLTPSTQSALFSL